MRALGNRVPMSLKSGAINSSTVTTKTIRPARRLTPRHCPLDRRGTARGMTMEMANLPGHPRETTHKHNELAPVFRLIRWHWGRNRDERRRSKAKRRGHLNSCHGRRLPRLWSFCASNRSPTHTMLRSANIADAEAALPLAPASCAPRSSVTGGGPVRAWSV